MAFGAVTLTPGVNSERTPTLLRAGISQSSLIRFKDDLVQKDGGWQRFYPYQVSGTPRDLHAWQDLDEVAHLSVGTTTQLAVITPQPNGSPTFKDITPQTLISDFAPNISTTGGSPTVTIVDPNINGPTIYDSVFFNVPVSVGGLILDGLYPIASVTGQTSYTITAPENAAFTQTNPNATDNTTAIGNNTLHFSATPSWVQAGMSVFNLTHPSSIPPNTQVLSSTGSTVVMTNNAAAPGVSSADEIVICSVPVFTTTQGSAIVSVKFINHGLTNGEDEVVVFAISTAVGGVTIVGSYDVLNVSDVNTFTIQASTQATSSATQAMDNGDVELLYYIALGPTTAGQGYGLGLYGEGNYGFGTGSGTVQTGLKITAVDWTSDNWGEILMACPRGGAIYYWDPNGGFINAQVISTGPPFNNGIFVSTTEQILIAFGSSVHQAIGYELQPLVVEWCDVSNFFQWQAMASDQAGNFVIPVGSMIMAGAAVANQNLLWTDLDLWAMAYIGPPDVFGFNKIGAGMGAVSAHAVQQLRGSVYWMGRTNFYSYTSNGAAVIPCPVWDAVFQNLNTNFLQNIRAMPNTPFNEVGWFFPSSASTSGECDSYVKFNITDPGAPWDYGIGGVMPRSAWIDQTVLGMPIGASPQGFIYQHETSPDADGAPLIASFTTGFFYLAEGEDFVIVDQILPDFKWSIFTGGTSAQIQMTFNLADYPGDTPRSYGPYTVTQATEFIWLRQRGRLMSITVESSDIGSFWRLGSIKYRYAPAGRR